MRLNRFFEKSQVRVPTNINIALSWLSVFVASVRNHYILQMILSDRVNWSPKTAF